MEKKTEWGTGPWQDEPDRAEWIDEATGLDCLIVRGPVGALCGYVGVPPEHPDYGKHYDDVDVSVHGGLTYSDECGGHVCHEPQAGRPEKVWWLGFDCAHYMDYSPGLAATLRSIGDPNREIACFEGNVYRDINYVRAECASLAKQLADRAGNSPAG